jgi:hypothetical protein
MYRNIVGDKERDKPNLSESLDQCNREDHVTEVELVPLVDAARRLRVSWARAWRLVLVGDLKARQVGGRWYVEEPSLRLRESETHPSPAA